MNKKLVFILLTVLELLIQLLFFGSIAVTMMFVAADMPYNSFYKIGIVLMPVIILYYSRIKVKNYTLFLMIHGLFIIAAVAIGNNDSEKFFMALAIILLDAYSIRLKTMTINRSNIANMPLQEVLYETKTQLGDERGSRKLAVSASERVPAVGVIIIAGGFIGGQIVGKSTVMYIQLVIAVIYILLQVLYNNLKNLQQLFILNRHKKDFPAKQIVSVNIFIMGATLLLMLIAMIVFYGGDYGGVFSILGKCLVLVANILCRLLVGFLMLISGLQKKVHSDITVDESDSEEKFDFDLTDLGTNTSNVAQIIFGVIEIAFVIAIIIALIVYVRRYAGIFKKSSTSQLDTVEFIKSSGTSTKKDGISGQSNVPVSDESNNKAARKLYKKAVKKKKGRKIIDETLPPEKITKQYIKVTDQDADRITNVYEKARYSDTQIDSEELDILKKL